MSIASEISRLQQAKADLKTSIESKGVTVSSSATLEDYPDYVDAISQGSVTQDQDGFIVLPSTGGGGGGGSPWAWQGKNPTLIKDYGVTKVWLKDSPYSTWTPSTTATQLSTATDMESCSWNATAYDYVVLAKWHTHYEYGAGATGHNQTTEFYAVNAIDMRSYSYNLAGITAGTLNGTGSATCCPTFSGVFYLDSYGNNAYAQASGIGAYPSFATPTITSSTITPKAPSVYARCQVTYFTVENAEAVNQNTSYYEYKFELWQVDLGTSNNGAASSMIRDMWLNGL